MEIIFIFEAIRSLSQLSWGYKQKWMIKKLHCLALLITLVFLLRMPVSAFAGTSTILFKNYHSSSSIHLYTESAKKVYGDGIKLFPNPAGDYFRIENGFNIKQIEVINVLGKVVKVYSPQSQSENFYIGDLSTGLYLVRMLNKNNDVVKTIRLQKK